MMNANAFLRRMLLVAAVSALSMVNVAYAHGGGGGKGTGGSSSGGGSASSGSSSGHSASSTNSGHSPSSTSVGQAATTSKGRQSAHDPVNVSQSPNATYQHVRVYRIFQQVPSTGYTTQYRETNNDDWRRKHQRLFLGFIRY
ncbi:MAG: hypothetical protein JOZ31_04660 [Verrucomicrobia bacterium]|nr:hypothetical protein [Verrucomicrobiota bacterium]MBV8483650.1 hypothetical protein [Verrucomicrobiota bacterium]